MLKVTPNTNECVKINSAPTSNEDYTVKASSVATGAMSTYEVGSYNNVTKYYTWEYGNYTSAVEHTMTQNSSVELRYYHDNDGKCCFLPNTLINTSNGKVKIENIKVGDFVGCYDIEYKDYIYGSVTKVIKNTNITELATLELENGTKVQFNSYHPILTQNGWKSLTNFNDYPTLTENDVMINGEKIKSIKVETLSSPLVGYNLVVEPINNFLIESQIVAEGSNNK